MGDFARVSGSLLLVSWCAGSIAWASGAGLPSRQAERTPASSLTQKARPAKPAPPNALALSFSTTSTSLRQTGINPVSASLLTAKLDYRRQFQKSRWSLGLNTFLTLLPVSSNLPAGASLRFLGVNGRLGYRLTDAASPWSVETAFGLYYQTTLVSGSSFGYQHLTGPQLLLRVARIFRTAGAAPSLLGGYAKYAMMSEGFRLARMTNHEMAAGLSWAGKIAQLPLSFSLDYATLEFGDGVDTISVRSFSVGAGYRWSF